MSLEGSSASFGEEILIENGQSESRGGVAYTSSSSQESGIGDRPFPLPDSLSQPGVLWDGILVSVIVIVASIVIYFVIRYFLNNAADSLQLDRGQLKGILSITKQN